MNENVRLTVEKMKNLQSRLDTFRRRNVEREYADSPMDGNISYLSSIFSKFLTPDGLKDAESQLNLLSRENEYFRDLVIFCNFDGVNISLRNCACFVLKNSIEKASRIQIEMFLSVIFDHLQIANDPILNILIESLVKIIIKENIFLSVASKLMQILNMNNLSMVLLVDKIIFTIAKLTHNDSSKHIPYQLKIFMTNNNFFTHFCTFTSQMSPENVPIILLMLKTLAKLESSVNILQSRKCPIVEVIQSIFICLRVPLQCPANVDTNTTNKNFQRNSSSDLRIYSAKLLRSFIMSMRYHTKKLKASSKEKDRNPQLTSIISKSDELTQQILDVILESFAPFIQSEYPKVSFEYISLLKSLFNFGAKPRIVFKNMLPQLLEQFLFPCLVLCTEQRSMLYDSPEEFINQIFTNLYETEFPSNAACSFLKILCQKSKSFTLISTYVMSKISRVFETNNMAGNLSLSTEQNLQSVHLTEASFQALYVILRYSKGYSFLTHDDAKPLVHHILGFLDHPNIPFKILSMRLLSRIISLSVMDVELVEDIIKATTKIICEESNLIVVAGATASLYRQLRRMPEAFLVIKDHLQKILMILYSVSAKFKNYDFLYISQYLSEKYPRYMQSVALQAIEALFNDFIQGSAKFEGKEHDCERDIDYLSEVLACINHFITLHLNKELIAQIQPACCEFIHTFLVRFQISNCLGEIISLILNVFISNKTTLSYWNFFNILIQFESIYEINYKTTPELASLVDFAYLLINEDTVTILGNVSLLQMMLNFFEKLENLGQKSRLVVYSCKLMEIMFLRLGTQSVDVHQYLCQLVVNKLEYYNSHHILLSHAIVLSAFASQPQLMLEGTYNVSQNPNVVSLASHLPSIIQKFNEFVSLEFIPSLGKHLLMLYVYVYVILIRKCLEPKYSDLFSLVSKISFHGILVMIKHLTEDAYPDDYADSDENKAEKNDEDDDLNMNRFDLNFDDFDGDDLDQSVCNFDSSMDEGSSFHEFTDSDDYDDDEGPQSDAHNDEYGTFISHGKAGGHDQRSLNRDTDASVHNLLHSENEFDDGNMNEDEDDVDSDDQASDDNEFASDNMFIPGFSNEWSMAFTELHESLPTIIDAVEIDPIAEFFCFISQIRSENSSSMKSYIEESTSNLPDNIFARVMVVSRKRFMLMKSKAIEKNGGYNFTPTDLNIPLPKEYVFT